jgi:hypothetical protein
MGVDQIIVVVLIALCGASVFGLLYLGKSKTR